ncbi:MAG: C4-type zinc ribbon domain-containing protein [Candidatus Omnitrophica bacterium]|nr:C4-type zinc ribbon domain-containing protein [Candidatus Omnitrophota bacterium]
MSDLEILKKAQVLDKEIYGERAILESIPENRHALDSVFEEEKENLKKLEAALTAARMKQKERENDLQEKETNIRKLDGQLSLVKTNKEYAAIQQQVASLKADNSLLEEEIIKLMDEVERAEKETNAEKNRLQTLHAKCEEEKLVLGRKEEEAKKRIAELKAERENVVKDISPETRQLYERIISAKRGIALSPVKNEGCGICHMQLRAQVLNEVMSKDKLVLCENCSRILYIPE